MLHFRSDKSPPHDFRRTFMTKMKKAGIALDEGCEVVGCNPATMRKYYVAVVETERADEILQKLAAFGTPSIRIAKQTA